jgi:hypothetical protein
LLPSFTRVEWLCWLGIPQEGFAMSNGQVVNETCTAFDGPKRIASGDLVDVARAVKSVLDRDTAASVLIFDDSTGEQIEVDFRGTAEEVASRIGATGRSDAAAASDGAARTPRGPGRPKLGVVAREVTLLPRHWDWLNRQPGGASVALRRLVENARRVNGARDRGRAAQESAYRFSSSMAGNEPGFEEATRALFAGNAERFEECSEAWPADVRSHARRLARVAFENAEAG